MRRVNTYLLMWTVAVCGAGVACTNDDGDGTSAPTGDGQVEFTAPTPLLNPDGTLAAQGWARNSYMEYNPEFISEENRRRLKEWEHYTIIAPDGALSVTLADVNISTSEMGTLVMSTLEYIDYETEEVFVAGDIEPDAPDSLTLPLTPWGNTDYEHSGNTISYAYDGDYRGIAFDFPESAVGPGMTAAIELFDLREDDHIAMAAPFDFDGSFFYENKIFALPASGDLQVGGRSVSYNPAEAFAVLDWGRGVWPEESDWIWGAGAGYQGDTLVGLNIGYVNADHSKGTSNAVSVDGTLHKLGVLHFEFDEDDMMLPWLVTDESGRLDLTLTPYYHEVVNVDLVFAVMHVDKMHGFFNGSVTLDDGTVQQVSELRGFIEKAYQQW